jgi:hypothetical protein
MRLPRPDCIGTRNDTPLSAGARRLIPLSLRSTPLFLSLRGTTVPKQSRWGAQWWLDRHIPIASGLAMTPSSLSSRGDLFLCLCEAPPYFCLCEARQCRSNLGGVLKRRNCRIRLKDRATKREVPDKSGDYKNLDRSEAVLCA